MYPLRLSSVCAASTPQVQHRADDSFAGHPDIAEDATCAHTSLHCQLKHASHDFLPLTSTVAAQWYTNGAHACQTCAITDEGPVQAQQAVGDGTRVVDVLLTWPGGRLAVEVDGPHHFLTDPDTGARRRNGATVLRDAQLRRWGIDVLSVPVEGRSLRELRSPAFRAELAAMLRDHGVPL